ncbi:hypothetical protein JG687_00013945 [Phytophthora cactorum]|uniref:DUF155 domain-containing protein n=1 Tax=Phytophthora cactorum TaxID=29920 RepID=A0A8T1TY48_9STRA|nr:hypothetical protein JG687_00013945 [Phytophthora cactorum]
MPMQESPSSIELSAGISTPARRRRRTRQSISPVASVSLEDPNDGDKDSDEDVEDLSPPIPVVVLTAPLATVPEIHKSPKNDVDSPPFAAVRAVGFPVANARRTGLQAKERAVGTDLIALFKLQKWMEKSAKESRRVEATEAKKEAISTVRTGLGLANWKNEMYLEVLHQSFTPEQSTADDSDMFTAQRAAALQEKHAFFFEEEEARRLMMLTPFSSGMMDQVDVHDMEFSYGDRSSIAKDSIVLCSLSVAEKIALSFAMSQSATLGAFETRVEDRIRSTKHIPSSLASVGSIQYSQNDTSKLIGHLFIELADVNIHSNVLDEPEYFLKSQDNDDFKYLYEKMLKYQDLASRVAILNKRLSILRDLVGVLNQQLTHHHGAKLEWIIIWMLVFQVIIAIGWEIVLKDILGYFHWG